MLVSEVLVSEVLVSEVVVLVTVVLLVSEVLDRVLDEVALVVVLSAQKPQVVSHIRWWTQSGQ